MKTKKTSIKIFSGLASIDLSKKICDCLKLPLGDIETGRFPDGEIWIKVNENVRGADVFVIQSTYHPVNEHLMELLLIMDTLKRASANRITAVIPYYGYARQDRKDQPRVAISAKLVANLLTTAGADRVLAMDLHASQIQGFFDIPVDHLIAEPVLVKYFINKQIPNLVVTSTDVGGARMAQNFAIHLKCPFAIMYKRRKGPQDIESMTLIGDVKGKNVLIPDDMISTGGTLVEAANYLKEKGANDIYSCCTHAVFCGSAVEKLQKSPLKEIIVTDTVPQGNCKIDKVKVLSVSKLFGEAIKSIHNETSVSKLFKIENVK